MPLLKWLARFCLACFVAAVVLAVVVISLLSGCSWFEEMTSRQTVDTRIVLEKGQRMDFNMMTKKNEQGQRVEEFRCPVGPMTCRGSVITMSCTCENL